MTPPSASEEEGILSRSNRRAGDEVDRLRRVVRDLTARRVTRQEEEWEASPTERPRPVPAPPVVIVRRVLASSRNTPRSFWTTSTLRSTHLRTLR